MASFFKNLSPAKIKCNLARNCLATSNVAEHFWDLSQRFDGCSLALDTIRELHLWHWLFTWSTVWLIVRSYTFIFGLSQLLTGLIDFFYQMCGESMHLKPDPDPDPHIRRKLWYPDYRSPRREQRRFQKYKKKFQVHSISNILDIFELLQHGGLTHFAIGNGWIICFATGLSCLGQVLGMPENYISDHTSDKSGLSEWLWPGQPPWTFLEHVVTSTVCTILVFVSFSITVIWATSRISSRSKKGSILSFCRKLAT